MAFKNAPVADTYSTQRVPLVQSNTVDPIYDDVTTTDFYNMMINVLPKKFQNHDGSNAMYSRTRPGVTALAAPAGISNAQMRGFYVWEKTSTTVFYFVVIGTVVFTSNAPSGPFTAVNNFVTVSTNVVRFTEFISSTNVKTLIVVDGVEGIVYTSNAAGTKITDVDFPTPHVPFPVFLDGRLYLAKASTGDIYCSDLDNAANWTAGNFISSEVYPDDVQALVKIENSILAIGLVGSEYFYDAGNATGSPLARIENASLPFGTNHYNTIASTFNTIVLLTKSPDGGLVLRRIEGFKHEEIPCNFLNQLIPKVITVVTQSPFVTAHLWRDAGQLYYTININCTVNSNTAGNSGLTFTYCFDTGMWVQFTRGVDSGRVSYGSGAHKPYPVLFSQPGFGGFHTLVAGQAFNAPFVGYLDETARGTDTLYINSTSTSINYAVSSVTISNLNFGTLNRKFMHRLAVDYVNDDDDGSTDALIPRVTTWDYPSAQSTAVARSLMSSNFTAGSSGFGMPMLTQLGAFRNRWVKVESYGSMTYRYIDIDINKGSQ